MGEDFLLILAQDDRDVDVRAIVGRLHGIECGAVAFLTRGALLIVRSGA